MTRLKPRPGAGAHRHEDKVLLLLTLIIGAVVGLAVVLFIVLTENLGGRLYPAGSPAWRRVLIPIAGSLISGFLLHRYFPAARGSGIPQTKAALFLHDGYITFRTVLGKFGLCSLSLASGIALGREGPSVHVGAGIASTLGRKLGLSTASVKALVPIGASAALAAAFNTPISAVLFSLEEVMGDMHAPVLGSVVLSSATSWIVLHLVLGDEPLFHAPAYQLVHPVEFVFYAALGLAGGIVSVAFVKLLLWQRKMFQRAPRRLGWLLPAVGGVTVGLLGWQHPEVLGVGYSYVGKALNGQMVAGTMALLVALKVVATATCYSSGNAGGIFGPSLFMGAMMGGAVGAVAHSALPDYTGSVGAYALVGMGAAFAGIVRVPLTSVIMIFEITRDYSIIVPLMIANLISYFLSSRLQEEPIYEALQHQDGIRLPSGARARESLLTVGHALRAGGGTIEVGTPVLHPDDPLESAMRRLADGRVKELPVVSRTNLREAVGTVSIEDVLSAYAMADEEVVGDAPAGTGSRLLAGVLAAVVGVAVLGGFLSYFYRAERAKRADRAYEAAAVLERSERLPEAIEQYRYALSISHRPEHRLALALALVKAERTNEASIYLREILRDQPDSGPANRAMAGTLAAEGLTEQAAAYYRRALVGSWPDTPEAHRFEVRTELAELLRKSGKGAEARAEMQALAANPPKDPALRKQAAHRLIDYGLWTEAAELYRQLLEEGPPDAAEYDGLGEALYRGGDYRGAGHAFRQALNIDPADATAARRAGTVDKVLALDPTRRGLPARERFRRSQELLRSVLGLTAACGGSEHEAAAQARLSLAKKAPPRSFSDAADENVAIAERIWTERDKACRAPDDEPAIIVLAKVAR